MSTTGGRFNPVYPITDQTGRPTQYFRDYVNGLDGLIALLFANYSPKLVNAANDAAAKAAGVKVGQFYRNGSIVMQRQA